VSVVPRRPNTFSGPYVDRVAHLRKDPAWVDAMLHSDRARIVPVHDSRSLVERGASGASACSSNGRRRSVSPDTQDCGAARRARREGLLRARRRASPGTSSLRRAVPTHGSKTCACSAACCRKQEAGVLAYARGMLYWRQASSVCGSVRFPNDRESAGHVMRCTNPRAPTEHFPRLDPAIIVLVTDGERALARPPGVVAARRYSHDRGLRRAR
jgi:NAD+ diphosphatase